MGCSAETAAVLGCRTCDDSVALAVEEGATAQVSPSLVAIPQVCHRLCQEEEKRDAGLGEVEEGWNSVDLETVDMVWEEAAVGARECYSAIAAEEVQEYSGAGCP